MARILIVDDQKIPRVATARTLAEAGHEVETASDGPSGIELAIERAPDVIILDVNMPGMDGFEVVRHLKEDARTEPIPVIFLTGTSSSDTLVARGLELGAFDFLTKGCSRQELLARVGVMARIKRGNDELTAVARIAETLIQSLDPEDLSLMFLEQTREVFRAGAALLHHVPPDGRKGRRYTVGLEQADDPLIDALATCLADGEDWTILPADEVEGPAGAFLRRTGFSTLAMACVRHPDREPTVLTVLFEDGAEMRREADAALLRLLAGQVNIALDNAVLHTRTRAQARKLERAMSERSRFFASMSHELRTPINAIVGYTELLHEGTFGPLDEPQRNALARVERSARHLVELINDILDISKLEAGKMEITPSEVDLAMLIRDTATSVQLMAEEKGLDLDVDLESDVRIRTDPARVRQIVLNLMANAVKFTKKGGVRIVLRATGGGGEGSSSVEIRVEDTGPGIEEEDRDRIFEEFEQVGELGAGGTGLGLPISRRLAGLLGGELSVESEVGRGSTFSLALPPTPPRPPDA